MPRWPTLTVEERLLQKVADAGTGCWEWTGAINRTGYGSIKIDRRTWLAHRVAFEVYRGPIPHGLTLDHLCRNTRCVNPSHLEPVTNRENILRGTNRAAMNARKTHCKRGHAFTPENTRSYPSNPNRRYCMACRHRRP